jgi:hypothetical protein
MSATGNLDAITRHDNDTPRKLPFGPYPGAVTTTMAWATSPLGARVYEPGLGIRTTFWSLPRLSAGNRQARINNTVRRHVNLQMPGHLTFACNTRLHCGHSPSCINRVVVPPREGIDIYADERSLLHFVSDISTCLNHL